MAEKKQVTPKKPAAKGSGEGDSKAAATRVTKSTRLKSTRLKSTRLKSTRMKSTRMK